MENNSSNKEVKDLSYLQERVPYLVSQFEKLTPYRPTKREKGDPNNDIQGWKSLAIDEAGYLMSRFPDKTTTKDEDKTYSTCLSYISQLKKALLKDRVTYLSDPQTTNQVKTIINNFHQQLLDFFAIYRARKNTEYKARKSERSEAINHVEIDPTFYLNKANDILEGIYINPDVEDRVDVNWEDVSCALDLVIGRRMAEIHWSGSFTKLDEYSVTFVGQLKGKNRSEFVNGVKTPLIEVPFEIPTLVKADYVIAGLNWLVKSGRKCDEQRKVNSNISRYVNEKSRASWSILPDFLETIDHLGKTEEYQNGDSKVKTRLERDYTMTYHKFRSIYMLLVVTEQRRVNPNMGLKELANFYKSVLGDNDTDTLEAYERFSLKEGAITKV